MLRDGYEIVMIGHRGHPESEGTMGQASRRHAPGRDGRGRGAARSRGSRRGSPTSRRPRCRSTTPRASWRRCKARFPEIRGPEAATTSATRRRTARTRSSSWRRKCDVVIVVGSPNSSNSNRLREVARAHGRAGLHGRQRRRAAAGVDRRQEARRHHRRRLGARGAGERADRAPEGARRGKVQPLEGITESVVFTLPRELARTKPAG